jgi:hypothetical protein
MLISDVNSLIYHQTAGPADCQVGTWSKRALRLVEPFVRSDRLDGIGFDAQNRFGCVGAFHREISNVL